MKRFLSKNTIKILIILMFVGFSFSFIRPLAKPLKLEYYKELFGKEFGFKIFESDKETVEKKNYLSSDSTKGYSVYLTSSLNSEPTTKLSENLLDTEKDISENSIQEKIDLFNISKAIIICDKEFSFDYPFDFYCDENTYSSEDALDLGVFLRSFEGSDIDYYVIPENNLLSPDGRSDLINYIKAMKRSDDAPEVSEDAEAAEEGPSIIFDIKSFKDTMVFEFFILALSMFFIASLSWGLLRFLALGKRKINLNLVRDFFDSFKNLYLYQKIILPIVILMGLLYIPLVFLIGIKDGQGINLGYFVSYTKGTLNIFNLNDFAYTGNIFRIAVFGYVVIVIGLGFIFLLPLFVKVISRFWNKISFSKVSGSFYKYSISVLILLSILISSFIEISSSVKFLIFILVLLSGIYIKLSFDNEFPLNYTKKERFVLILASLLILFSGMFFRFGRKDGVLDYKYEDLIGISDEVVLLPYSKQVGSNTLINEYKFSGSEPVFVDQYLVYSPIHSRIENKSASDFKNEGSFYIQNGDLEEIVKTINKNTDLLNVMLSESPSNLFRIKNPRLLTDEKVNIEITFSCEKKDIDLDKIKADIYYVDSDGEVKEDDKTLVYFPGCLDIAKPETLSVNFEYPYSDSEYIYVRLVDVLPSDIYSIRILGQGLIIEPEYISKSKEYSIIDSGGLTTSAIVPITNYIFGDPYELSFDLNVGEKSNDGLNVDGNLDLLENEDQFYTSSGDSAGSEGFDISQPINELIREGALKERFLIWSTRKYLPVRLPDRDL